MQGDPRPQPGRHLEWPAGLSNAAAATPMPLLPLATAARFIDLPAHAARRVARHPAWWLGACAALWGAAAAAQPADGAAKLAERHAALREALRGSPLQRPIVIESQHSGDMILGRVYAVIDQPFAQAAQVVPVASHWCDILMLHLNNKQCQLGQAGTQTAVALWVSRRYDIPLEKAQRIDFVYQVQAQSAGYVDATLSAAKGPLGTHDYRIEVEAMALPEGRTFLHMAYAYEAGMAARMAMQAYLATAGREKIGFTVTERKADGKAVYVGGLRGLVERNTMRYFLAFDAYIAALAQPLAQQQEFRLKQWITAVERYAPQLHEADETEYLEMKRRELKR